MATFTMELRKVLQLTPDIGLGNYPIFDEAYRVPLNNKIIDRFLMREIGAETVELFRHYMARKMNEIMPEYNQFYESQRLKIDPFMTMSVKSLTAQDSETTNTSTSSAENNSDAKSKSRAVDSATPQSMLGDSRDYATAASDTISNTENTGIATDSAEANMLGATKVASDTTGYSGAQSDLLNKYRTTFLNIDLEILNRLDREGLFMNIWSSGDDYFRRENTYGNTTNPAYHLYPGF